jgi:hypothetical protein
MAWGRYYPAVYLKLETSLFSVLITYPDCQE